MRFRSIILLFTLAVLVLSACSGSAETSDALVEPDSAAATPPPTETPEQDADTSSSPAPAEPDDEPATAAPTETAVDEGEPEADEAQPEVAEVRLTTSTGTANRIAVLSDGTVATVGVHDNAIHYWDPARPDETLAVQEGVAIGGLPRRLLELPDDRMLLGMQTSQIQIVDPDWPQTRLDPFDFHSSVPSSISTLPDGNVVSAADGVAAVWDPRNPTEVLHSFDGLGQPSVALGLADGSILTSAEKANRLAVRNASGIVEVEFECECGWLSKLHKLDDQHSVAIGTTALAIVTRDGVARSLPLASRLSHWGQALATFDDDRIAFKAPDENDNTIHIWDPASDSEETLAIPFDGSFIAIAVSPDQTLIVSTDTGVHLIDPDQPESPIGRYAGHEGQWNALAESNGNLVAANGDGRIYVWEVDDPTQPPTAYANHDKPAVALTALPGGRIASSESESLHIWSVGDPASTLSMHSVDVVRTLATTAEGDLVVGNGMNVEIRDGESPGIVLETFTGHTGIILDVTVMADGRIASAGDETVRVWDPTNPAAAPVVYEGHEGGVVAVEAVADGAIVSSSRSESLDLWHPDNPTEPIAKHSDRGARNAHVVELLPDGRFATAGNSTAVFVWGEGQQFAETSLFTKHRSLIEDLLVLSDGRIATAGGDGILIWDLIELVDR